MNFPWYLLKSRFASARAGFNHTIKVLLSLDPSILYFFTAEVQKEVERIYELTKSLKMVVIDCDVINHPSQLVDCSLAPISIYIKMEPQILEKLVKLRGSKRKNLGAQVVAAQKLAQCNEVTHEYVIAINLSVQINTLPLFISFFFSNRKCSI